MFPHSHFSRRLCCALGLLCMLAFVPALALPGLAQADPAVVSTSPENADIAVDPATSTISVTFTVPMQDNSWSWVQESEDTFPELTGQPFYSEDLTTCTLPVALEPSKSYVIWINSDQFKNFKGQDGTPAIPYRLSFSTTQ